MVSDYVKEDINACKHCNAFVEFCKCKEAKFEKFRSNLKRSVPFDLYDISPTLTELKNIYA